MSGLDRMNPDVWLEGPEACFDRECEEYVDDEGHDVPEITRCSHIREVPSRVSTQDAPAPRPAPRVWRYGKDSDVATDVTELIGKATGRHWHRVPDRRFMWQTTGLQCGIGSLLFDENELTESPGLTGTAAHP